MVVLIHFVPSEVLHHVIKLCQESFETPVPLYGVNFISKRGVLDDDVLVADCTEVPTDTGGTCLLYTSDAADE